ncbi:dachshund homolog 1, partial [Frankliniella occidentalis]|uniref:Dachshund homolog 1 n=1 Tax=Frankliniella occidentalis TaxID=133901 RepID=A0A9C6TYC9_FRAOC
CNVEQVRILRGLGAIQPGVNRCKLLSCKDFDTLYRDCTTARCLTSHRTPDSSRPGRPPKRVPMGLSLPASLQGHPQLKKHRLENGDFASFENGPIGENRMEKSPLLSNGYNAPPTHLHPMHQFYHPGLPHPGSVLKGQSTAPLEAIARSGIWEDCRAAYEDIVKHLERLRENRGDADARQSAMGAMGPLGAQGEDFANGHSPVLNLSKGTAGSAASAASAGSRASAGSPGADHSDSEAGASDKDDDDDLNSNAEDDEDERGSAHQDTKPPRSSPGSSPPPLPTNLAHLTVGVGVAPLAGLGAGLGASLSAGLAAKASVGGDPRLTSTETILRNIEGLLQVAADNARQQERQINMEKAELKMDVMREREVKESLERQLLDETRTRVLCQKRLKKVRRASRRLQEQLELEMKRRSQLEEVLRTTGASSEALRILTEMKATSTGSSNSEMTSPRSSPAERRSVSPSAAAVPRPQSQPPPNRSFWQNYSENLAQELENERKAKQKKELQQNQPQEQHRQQLMQHDSEPIAMDLDSKPLVQDLRWPTEHRAAIIS